MGDTDDFGGANYALVRDEFGNGQPWLGFQNVVYQLLNLPGEMRVCAGGASLNVRAGWSVERAVIGSLADGAVVTVDWFVLSVAQTSAGQGEGWYHVRGEVKGWAPSRYLFNALLRNCTVRDLQPQE